MTNPDFYGLISQMAAELDHCQQLLMDDRRQRHPLADHARAALAEADGPAVSEGREPASVATQPSDEELRELWQNSWDTSEEKGAFQFARAVLARFGRPAAAPVPEPGEMVAALKVIDKMQQEWVLLGNDDGTASPSLSMPISLRRFTVLRDALSRAATLLQQQAAHALPQPVPVSERLPEPEDCDAEGRCWRYMSPEESMGNPMWELARSKYAGANYGSVAWLPANALPLPAPEGGEVS